MGFSVMRHARSPRISTSLYALFGLFAPLMSGQALTGAMDALRYKREAVEVEEVAAANRELFAALIGQINEIAGAIFSAVEKQETAAKEISVNAQQAAQ